MLKRFKGKLKYIIVSILLKKSILLVIDNLDLNISKSLKQKYRDYYNLLIMKSNQESEEKAKSFDFSITPFKDYLKMNEKLLERIVKSILFL